MSSTFGRTVVSLCLVLTCAIAPSTAGRTMASQNARRTGLLQSRRCDPAEKAFAEPKKPAAGAAGRQGRDQPRSP